MNSSIRKFYGRHHDLLTVTERPVSQITTFVVITIWSFPYSRLVIRVTRRMPQMGQELLSFPKHLKSPPVLYSSWWGSCCSCCQITCLLVVSSVLWFPLRFPRKNDVRFDLRIMLPNAISISDDVRVDGCHIWNNSGATGFTNVFLDYSFWFFQTFIISDTALVRFVNL